MRLSALLGALVLGGGIVLGASLVQAQADQLLDEGCVYDSGDAGRPESLMRMTCADGVTLCESDADCTGEAAPPCGPRPALRQGPIQSVEAFSEVECAGQTKVSGYPTADEVAGDCETGCRKWRNRCRKLANQSRSCSKHYSNGIRNVNNQAFCSGLSSADKRTCQSDQNALRGSRNTDLSNDRRTAQIDCDNAEIGPCLEFCQQNDPGSSCLGNTQ